MTRIRIGKKVLFGSAVALLAGLTAAAQIPPGGSGGQQSPGGRQTYPSQTGEPGVQNTNIDQTRQFVDKSFVEEALKGGDLEVQLGQLALQKSQSEDVKQFGRKMVQDHTQLGDQMKNVAQKMGIGEPKGPSKKDRQLIARLEALSGPQFDEEYIKAMVKDHRQDLKDFKNEAQVAQDPDLQQTVQRGYQVVAQHLQMIEQIAQAHNVTIEASNKKE